MNPEPHLPGHLTLRSLHGERLWSLLLSHETDMFSAPCSGGETDTGRSPLSQRHPVNKQEGLVFLGPEFTSLSLEVSDHAEPWTSG